MQTPGHQQGGAARARALALGTLLGAVAACTTGGDSVTQPVIRGDVPWALRLNYGAITAAVGEEVVLAARPVTLDGTLVTGALPAITYTTSDTNVSVDASGRLVGKAVRSNVMVIAKMHSLEGNWTIADTVRVMVMEAPVAFADFRLLLNGPALVPANRSRRFDAFLYDASGAVVRSPAGDTIRPLAYYTASVPKNVFDITNPWGATGTPRNVGDVSVTGTSYVFGREYEAETSFRITYPDSAILNIYRVNTLINPSPSMMSQTDLTVIRGGKVGFRNLNTSENADIVFDDLANVVNGNIPVVPVTPAAPAIVQFPNLGQFTYRSSKGFGGTITVVDP